MKKQQIKSGKLCLGIITALIASVIFLSCSSNLDTENDTIVSNLSLTSLEEKYNVTLENNGCRSISEIEYMEIEEIIIKMKDDLNALKGNTYKLRMLDNFIKTRAIETISSDRTHVFGATLLTVICSIEDNSSFSLAIGIDGVTMYDSISIISQSNDYQPGANIVNFEFKLQAIASTYEINTYATEDYSGSADFTEGTVTFNKQ